MDEMLLGAARGGRRSFFRCELVINLARGPRDHTLLPRARISDLAVIAALPGRCWCGRCSHAERVAFVGGADEAAPTRSAGVMTPERPRSEVRTRRAGPLRTRLARRFGDGRLRDLACYG